jgi:hypothetical protein
MELWQFAKRWRCEFAETSNGQGTMHTPEEYRKYAEECERIARSVSPENRRILLNIARAWRERGDHAEKKIKDSSSSVDGD